MITNSDLIVIENVGIKNPIINMMGARLAKRAMNPSGEFTGARITEAASNKKRPRDSLANYSASLCYIKAAP